MGISIGQDRVRIGTQLYTNENYQTCLQDSFCRIMLMLFCVSLLHANLENFEKKKLINYD